MRRFRPKLFPLYSCWQRHWVCVIPFTEYHVLSSSTNATLSYPWNKIWAYLHLAQFINKVNVLPIVNTLGTMTTWWGCTYRIAFIVCISFYSRAWTIKQLIKVWSQCTPHASYYRLEEFNSVRQSGSCIFQESTVQWFPDTFSNKLSGLAREIFTGSNLLNKFYTLITNKRNTAS